MNRTIEKSIESCVARLLIPLIRVLLRYGVSYGLFSEIAKRAYVDVAMKDFNIPGRKPTISRAAVITGLSRREILRIRREPEARDRDYADESRKSHNRAVRVVGGWVRDPQFSDERGGPSPLPFEGSPRSFSELVRRYSGDVPPRALLDELLRVGAVEEAANGKIRLRGRAYVPSQSDVEKIAMLGGEVADLIGTIDHNLQATDEPTRFQLRVAYDNLPGEPLGRFKSLSAQESRKLLEIFDRELSGVDRDANPDSQGTGRYRAGVSIYYFEEVLPEDASQDAS